MIGHPWWLMEGLMVVFVISYITIFEYIGTLEVCNREWGVVTGELTSIFWPFCLSLWA